MVKLTKNKKMTIHEKENITKVCNNERESAGGRIKYIYIKNCNNILKKK